MSANQNLVMITRYMSWTNEVFYRSVSELPKPELTKERPMLFGNIISLLNHVYAMGVVWKCHIEGVPHNLTSRCPSGSPMFSELRQQQRVLDEWYIGHASNLLLEDADASVDFTFIGGGLGSMSHHQIILHVVNHASYHRGHIEGVFYQLGVEPPTTDLPVFLRDSDFKTSK